MYDLTKIFFRIIATVSRSWLTLFGGYLKILAGESSYLYIPAEDQSFSTGKGHPLLLGAQLQEGHSELIQEEGFTYLAIQSS